MIGSIFARAIAKPSRIWARSRAFRSSNTVRRVTTSRRCSIKASKVSFRLKTLGWPLSNATILIPNTVCNCVLAYKWLSSTSADSLRLTSTTIRIPSLSDSSRSAEIPSIRFSLTSSAIFSIKRALLTWYGISLMIMVSLPLSSVSISALARIYILPRPVR